MKENWWSQLAEKVQRYADAGNQQEFYSALKGVYGAKHREWQWFAESLSELPLMEDLDKVPTLTEVRDATLTLKNSKAPGPDSVPAEVVRYGGDTVLRVIPTFIDAA